MGGGTDYPLWYHEHGGAVLSTSIDKYCYISCRPLPPFFEHKHRIVYSIIESVKKTSDIKHPAVKAVLEYMNIQEGLEIHHDGDLPARSGIGSSSSFTVGLLNVIHALAGMMISKHDLSQKAIHLEQDVIGETVGSQDQIAVATGGLNKITFHTDGSFEVHPLILNRQRREEFQSHLMLFFSGFSRTAEVVAKSKLANFKNRTSQLKAMESFVHDGISILQNSNQNICDFGKLLHESWRLKKELSQAVSNDMINGIYEAGLEAGALGGKILGAGGGGFILFFVPPHLQGQVRARLNKLIEVEIEFETQGSRIILYDPNFGKPVSFRRNFTSPPSERINPPELAFSPGV